MQLRSRSVRNPRRRLCRRAGPGRRAARGCRDAVIEVVRESLIAALHGLLHGLSHDEEQIRLIFEGHDVASESDGLHGDLFWWLRDLSRHPCDEVDV